MKKTTCILFFAFIAGSFAEAVKDITPANMAKAGLRIEFSSTVSSVNDPQSSTVLNVTMKCFPKPSEVPNASLVSGSVFGANLNFKRVGSSHAYETRFRFPRRYLKTTFILFHYSGQKQGRPFRLKLGGFLK